MTMRHRLRSGSARRGFASIASAALLLSMMAVPASAEHFENTEVLDADNAVEAGVNWSEFTFDSASDVALGRNDKFPDNLASSVIQGTDTPLLYTDGDSLSEETAAELDRLGAETVHVLGGESAISEDVVEELEAMGLETHRDAGTTRIETAIDIAATHAEDATEGLVVRAFGDAGGDETRAWADALAAGGWAAEEGIPVFLTQTEELNDNLAAYLEDSAIESVTIVGGTSAVSAAVVSDLEALGIEVDRVFGVNRFATAVAIAEARGFADAGDADTVILSEGQQSDAWAGGFAAAAYSAISGAPIVLSNGATIPPETEEFLEGAGGDGSVALVCGPFVEPEACDEAATILGQEEAAHGNQTFTATPAEAATNTVSTGSDPNTNRGARTYTVTGLDNTQTYDIALLTAAGVTNTDGTYTFRDANSNNVADDLQTDTTGGVIEVVNGVAQTTPDGHVTGVTPTNGTITFSVDSLTADSVYPVVFRDADNGDDLDLAVPAAANANPKEPSELFAVGGQKTWNPSEAAIGAVNADFAAEDEDVLGVNKTENYFLTENNTTAPDGIANFTYFYDANDTFQVATAATSAAADEASVCNPVSMATFEAGLSTGDQLDRGSIYAPDPEAVSTFCLEDFSPAAPGTVAATEIDSDTIRVTWAAVTGADTYTIYRRQTTAPTACSTTLTDYTAVGTVPGSATPLQFDDNGLSPTTRYCYIVTATDDGDESSAGTPANATTTASGATADPQSTDAFLVTDGTVQGEISEGDVWRIIFDKVMAPINDGDLIRVQDAGGEQLNVVCDAAPEGAQTGEEADCVLNSAAVTIAGTSYPAGRVLTVTMDAVEGAPDDFTADNVVTGQDDHLNYPVTIVTQSGIVDTTGRQWTPADDPDKVIDNEGTKTETGTFTGDVTAPTADDATFTNSDGAATGTFGDAVGDVLTVTYSEAISAASGSTITVDPDSGTAADEIVYTCGTNVTCTGSGTTTLTVTVSDAAATDVVLNGALDEVDATTGVTDFASNAAAGYPETIDA